MYVTDGFIVKLCEGCPVQGTFLGAVDQETVCITTTVHAQDSKDVPAMFVLIDREGGKSKTLENVLRGAIAETAYKSYRQISNTQEGLIPDKVSFLHERVEQAVQDMQERVKRCGAVAIDAVGTRYCPALDPDVFAAVLEKRFVEQK